MLILTLHCQSVLAHGTALLSDGLQQLNLDQLLHSIVSQQYCVLESTWSHVLSEHSPSPVLNVVFFILMWDFYFKIRFIRKKIFP